MLSALYFSECAQAWAFHSLQVERKDSCIWVEGEDNEKSSRAMSLFSGVSQAKCAHLFTHPISLPVDQRRQDEIMLSVSFVFGSLRNFPFKRCLDGSFRSIFPFHSHTCFSNIHFTPSCTRLDLELVILSEVNQAEEKYHDFGKVVYTLLYLKLITNKDLMYSTWNSAQWYAASLDGRGIWEE